MFQRGFTSSFVLLLKRNATHRQNVSRCHDCAVGLLQAPSDTSPTSSLCSTPEWMTTSDTPETSTTHLAALLEACAKTVSGEMRF